MPTSGSQHLVEPPFAVIRFPWHWIVKVLPDRSVLHTTTLHILAFTYLLYTWLLVTNIFLNYIPNVLYGNNVWRIPWPFQDRYFLFSRNVLVFLELLHGARSCKRYIPSVGPQRIYMSLYLYNNRPHCQNEKYHAMHSDYCKISSVSLGSY